MVIKPPNSPASALQWLALASLRPTQITVGMQYVALKAFVTRRLYDAARRQLLERHPLLCVRAPDGSVFVIDHHHWAMAWHLCNIELVPVRFACDLRARSMPSFWRKMARENLLHPFDSQGRRRDPHELPATIALMQDDPYQSLAALTRRCGAYRKTSSRYSAFVWADFLRAEVPLDGTDNASMLAALIASTRIARSKKARGLPGYAGKA
ncbi:ParB-like protein [Paraburkholderia rhizosphaerae]|uniref:Chromosome partitioning protein ParB n=1 Tax=Paraburkholderia rhizosphaerae TaxID=480658 RepID=A0A4R8LLJ3_9BURK|nr:ParB-like protein [Paraburkholderia rhizosphaerae]TDY43877.1 hypothetical protein BX592_11779 [Paraburkholderia rhizosphaerae]